MWSPGAKIWRRRPRTRRTPSPDSRTSAGCRARSHSAAPNAASTAWHPLLIDGVDAGSLGSARAVSGWFGDDDAFTLLALRASESVGQEADLVAATLFEPEGWVPVDDPRLSTTYTGEGLPARASLELWIGEGENEFPRRAAGEAVGTGAALEADGLELHVVPMRCHSRGREGAACT